MQADDLFEMSNIAREDSGLPVRVWVSSGGSAHHRHDPRIKVELSKGADWIPVLLKRRITADDPLHQKHMISEELKKIHHYGLRFQLTPALEYRIMQTYRNGED